MVVLSGSRFTVVGLVSGVTYFAGQPVVFMPIASADDLDSNGLPLATAILVRGAPMAPVAGFLSLSDAQVPHRHAIRHLGQADDRGCANHQAR